MGSALGLFTLLLTLIEGTYLALLSYWWRLVIFGQTPPTLPVKDVFLTPPQGVVDQAPLLAGWIACLAITAFLLFLTIAFCSMNFKRSACVMLVAFGIFCAGLGVALYTLIATSQDKSNASNVDECITNNFGTEITATCSASQALIEACAHKASSWCSQQNGFILGTIISTCIIIGARLLSAIAALGYFVHNIYEDIEDYDSSSSYSDSRRHSSRRSSSSSFHSKTSYAPPPPPTYSVPVQPPPQEGIQVRTGDITLTLQDDGVTTIHV